MGASKTMRGACSPAVPRLKQERAGFGLAYVTGKLAAWLSKRRSRLDLLELTDEQLCDIGVSRSEAQREGLRPFWD